MDSVDDYRQIIRRILSDYASIPYAHGQIERKLVFDDEHGHYMLMAIGWNGLRRIHGCVIHIELINGKLWIQRDGTEAGVATDLLAAGIPHDQIVLGFRSEHIRPYTEFAVA